MTTAKILVSIKVEKLPSDLLQMWKHWSVKKMILSAIEKQNND